jgi:hypothetical protein
MCARVTVCAEATLGMLAIAKLKARTSARALTAVDLQNSISTLVVLIEPI